MITHFVKSLRFTNIFRATVNISLKVTLFFYLCTAVTLASNSLPAAELYDLTEAESLWLTQHPIIKMGIDPGYGPYSFVDSNGQAKGVALDFLDILSQQLGIQFEITSHLVWRDLIDAIKNKKIDAIATVSYLPERTTFLSFTDNYLITPLVVMTRSETPQLHTLKELEANQVALVQGYSSSKKLLGLFPNLRPYYTNSPKEGLQAVALGLADAYVGVLGVNEFIAQHHGITNLKINAAFDMENNAQAIGVRKDWQPLATILNKALKKINADQKEKILDQWLPVQLGKLPVLEQPSWTTRFFPWLMALFVIALTGYLISLSWNRQLQRRLNIRLEQVAEQNQEIDRLNGLLRSMIDASTDIIFVKDTEGNYLLGNKTFANLLDKSIEKIIGSNDQDLFPLELATQFRNDDKRVLKLNKTISYEEPVMRADGEIIPYLTTKGPIHDQDKQVGVFGISRDISEIKLAMDLLQNSLDEMEKKVAERTNELEETNAKLQNVNKELETFTYSVSHDLKAPLRGIDGYSRLLLEDHAKQLNEEGKLFLKNLRESSETMGQLIDDLLAYSRLERRSLQHHSLELKAVFERIKNEYRSELENVVLEEDIEPIDINTDPLALTLIIRNLLGNAIKFSAHAKPPKIQIKANRSATQILITIKDNGIGFDMQFHDRIFDIFQRLQRSEDYPGTGIGLAMSLKATQRLGGTLRAESEIHKGATFFLEFPL